LTPPNEARSRAIGVGAKDGAGCPQSAASAQCPTAGLGQGEATPTSLPMVPYRLGLARGMTGVDPNQPRARSARRLDWAGRCSAVSFISTRGRAIMRPATDALGPSPPAALCTEETRDHVDRAGAAGAPLRRAHGGEQRLARDRGRRAVRPARAERKREEHG